MNSSHVRPDVVCKRDYALIKVQGIETTHEPVAIVEVIQWLGRRGMNASVFELLTTPMEYPSNLSLIVEGSKLSGSVECLAQEIGSLLAGTVSVHQDLVMVIVKGYEIKNVASTVGWVLKAFADQAIDLVGMTAYGGIVYCLIENRKMQQALNALINCDDRQR